MFENITKLLPSKEETARLAVTAAAVLLIKRWEDERRIQSADLTHFMPVAPGAEYQAPLN